MTLNKILKTIVKKNDIDTISLDFAALVYSMASILMLNSLTPLLLDVVSPLNESRARAFMMEVDFKIDSNKYYAPLFVYTISLVVVGSTFILADDSMYVTCCVHACGLFSIIRWVHRKYNKYTRKDSVIIMSLRLLL